MSKARVAVLHVISGQLTVSAAAKTQGFSRQHLHRLLKRYREGGLQAVDPRSRRPTSNPRAVSHDVIVAIVRLRENLVDQGLEPGRSPCSGTYTKAVCRCHQPPRSGASCTTTG